MDVLNFVYKGKADNPEAWGNGGTLYKDDCINLIRATNCSKWFENVVKVTSIDRLTGEKHTEIMPCVPQDGDTMPDPTQSGIYMESGKMYFIEIEDLEGNVVFECTRAYSTTEGHPHKTVHGICNSSKCGVRVPSYEEFTEKTKDLSDNILNVSSKLTAKIGKVQEDIETIETAAANTTDEVNNIKDEVYGKFKVLSVSLPSMDNSIEFDYPDGFDVTNAFYIGCLFVESVNGEITETTRVNTEIEVKCNFNGITVSNLPSFNIESAGSGYRAYLKLLFMRAGL